MKRAQFWRNIFDTQTGYVEPRRYDGSFIKVDPAEPKYYVDGNEARYVEGNAAQYSWMVPYNMRALFDLMGGNAQVVERLDKFFTELNAGENKPYFWIGNEPVFAVPWAYDFAGAPWGAQSVTRRAELELFTPQPDGEPGNDDLGAMSAWYVFAALGAYPADSRRGRIGTEQPSLPQCHDSSGERENRENRRRKCLGVEPICPEPAREWPAFRKNLDSLQYPEPRRDLAVQARQHSQQRVGNQTRGRSSFLRARHGGLRKVKSGVHDA